MSAPMSGESLWCRKQNAQSKASFPEERGMKDMSNEKRKKVIEYIQFLNQQP
jgi:hypothetical protein